MLIISAFTEAHILVVATKRLYENSKYKKLTTIYRYIDIVIFIPNRNNILCRKILITEFSNSLLHIGKRLTDHFLPLFGVGV
jgi:hypothetical protein